MRTRYSVINALSAFLFQFIQTAALFLSRRVFLAEMGTAQFGINSLFTQILSMLSLAELGIGQAITFSLYKPMAEGDEEQIAAIMKLYRKVYTAIGFVIFLLAAAMTPFITCLISGDISEVKHIHLLFLLFAANTSLSYFSAYKQNLLIADQKKYIAAVYHGSLLVLTNIFQIAVLLQSHNFILYLLIQILFTILENLLLWRKSQREYPYISRYSQAAVSGDTLWGIRKNTGALLIHKIGEAAVGYTDILIISRYLGIGAVGKYTCYSYVVNVFMTMASQIFGAVTASVGNLTVCKKSDSELVFKRICYFNYCLLGVVSICSLALFNDFIRLMFGEKMLLESGTVFLLVLRLYIHGMRYSVLTFKNAAGLYWQDRVRPLVESAVNLVSSILFVKFLGISGVILGTIVCMTAVDLLWEPRVVYKYVFRKNVFPYYRSYVLCFITLLLPWRVGSWLETVQAADAGSFLIKGSLIFAAAAIYCAAAGWLFFREELHYFISLAGRIIENSVRRVRQ